MPSTIPTETLYIGWDVGGWSCEHNANSRDALVVLDAQRNLLSFSLAFQQLITAQGWAGSDTENRR